jgi:hypothetical protein
MKLQISFFNHLHALKFHLMGTFFMLVVLYYYNFERIFLLVAVILWIIYTLPTLYLHLKYYFINKGQEIIITNDELVLKYRNEEADYIFNKKEIVKIVLCRSASMDKGGIPLSSLETYQYIKVFLKNKSVVCITNLMAPNLDEVKSQFSGISFVREKGIFCLFCI